MKPEQDYKEILDEIKGIRADFVEHAKSDKMFQERMEPVLSAFENKKIVRTAIQEETKTWVFYVKSATSIAIFIAGAWVLLRKLLNL